MRGSVNMRLLVSFILLAWCPLSVLGGYSIVVQTGGGVKKPGDILNYVVSADPVPSWTLGLVLIGTIPDATGGAICWPWTTTMSATTKQGSIRVPSDVPPQLYTVDIHVNASIYSTKLATSNVFEVVANAPPTTQVTTNVAQTTKQTTQQVIVTTTQQTVVQQAPTTSPQSQPDPTSQAPVVSNKPVSTQNPSSNAPANSNIGSTIDQSGSTSPSQTLFVPSAAALTTDPAPTHSADSSVDIPPTTSEKKKSSAIGPAIGGAIGGIILILLLFFLWRRYNKKKQERIAIDDMAESNSRFTDRATTPATSAFASTFREFQPNRSNVAVSPFLLDSERSPPPMSPDPTMSSKYREAYGGDVGQTHHNNTSFGASTTSGTGGAPEQLRSERERVLGEISALRSRGGQASSSAYAQSSVSAGSSGGRDAADEEIRNRLDMLTQHVARLENALGQGAYEAPPTYHQAPSQAASQRD